MIARSLARGAGLAVALTLILCPLAFAEKTAAKPPAKSDAKPAETAPPAGAPAAPKSDPKADEVLAKVKAYYKGLKSFAMEARLNNKMEMQGMKMDMAATYKIAVQHPNKISIIGEGEGMMGAALSMTTVCDGQKLWRYMPLAKSYSEEEAPKDLNQVVFGGMNPMGIDSILFSLFAPDDSEYSMTKGADARQYIGKEAIDGVDCHRLRILAMPPGMENAGPEAPHLAVDVWVEAGDKPFIRRIAPDIAGMMKAMQAGQAPKIVADDAAGQPDPAELMKDMKMEMSFDYKNWKPDAQLAADAFAYAPPEGAKKSDNLMRDLAGAGAGAAGAGADDNQPEPAEALVGKAAPAFKLELAGGGEFDLAAQKDKQVIVLDFWATWCGPCRRAMPIIEEVTAGFKDKGVMLVTVNQGEPADKVRKYAAEKSIKAAIALDTDSKIGELYMVEGIPQTVVIGKDGVVAKVFVGVSETLKGELTETLQKLTAK